MAVILKEGENWTKRQMFIREDNVKAHIECPPEAKKKKKISRL